MNGIAAFLIAMVGPLMARLLVSLGVSIVSVSGVVVAMAALRAGLIQSANSLPADGLQLAGLFGVWKALGIILGAVTFVITWKSTAGFLHLAKK